MVIAASILADNYIIWWIAQLLAVGLLIFLVLRWRPQFLRGRTIGQTLDAALSAREEGIREQLRAAERSREEAARIREQAAQDIARAREESEQIVDRAHTTSEAIQSEMKTRAREEYERIVGQARVEIEYERRQAEQALRRRAADIVVDAALQVVDRHLDPTTDRKLIDESIVELRDVR